MPELNRRNRLLLSVAAIAIVVTLLVPTLVWGWSVLAHSTCGTSRAGPNEVLWVPLSVLNSPYGGSGRVVANIPPAEFGPAPINNPPTLLEGAIQNGSVWGAFFQVNASLLSSDSNLAVGPGDESGCSATVSVSLVSVTPAQGYQGGLFTWPGAPIFGPNSSTDRYEPTQINFTPGSGGSSSKIENGFAAANHANVSTCGLPETTLSMTSSFLTTWVTFRTGGTNQTVAVVFPFVQSFEYEFPENYGTWQVDNLSAPGGPGGGWAFSYSPCA
jgi:hypothetical protein